MMVFFNNTNATLLKSSSLLMVVIALLLLPSSCYGEKHVRVVMEEEVIPYGQLSSHAIFGTIHGSGRLDVAKLHYNFDDNKNENIMDSAQEEKVVVTTLMVDLSTKEEINKMKKWQEDDTASSRERRDEYLRSKGIGAIGRDGVYYVCCTAAALEAGACVLDWDLAWESNPNFYKEEGFYNLSLTGNMILKHFSALDTDEKPGSHYGFRVLDISNATSYGSDNDDDYDLGYRGVIAYHSTRHTALFFANCGGDSSSGTPTSNNSTTTITSSTTTNDLHIYGTITWTSFVSARTLSLYGLLLLFHGGLWLWYKHLMDVHRDSRIEVEKRILVTLFLAFIATLINTIHFVWEATAENEWILLGNIATICEAVARIVSRCLYLLLAMGVGVTKGKLESQRTTILIGSFLTLWTLSVLVVEVGMIYHYYYSYLRKTKLGQIFTMFAYIRLILTIVIMLWIPISIRRTLRLLKSHNDTPKLERYQWMWRIFCLAILLGIAEGVLADIDYKLDAGRDYDLMTQTEQADITYLIILWCMAYLWKPNPSQRMYSYQLLEDDDGDFGTDAMTMMSTDMNMSVELSPGKFRETVDEHDLQLSTTAGF